MTRRPQQTMRRFHSHAPVPYPLHNFAVVEKEAAVEVRKDQQCIKTHLQAWVYYDPSFQTKSGFEKRKNCFGRISKH